MIEHAQKHGELKYRNEFHDFPVKTKQEIDFKIEDLTALKKTNDSTYQELYNE